MTTYKLPVKIQTSQEAMKIVKEVKELFLNNPRSLTLHDIQENHNGSDYVVFPFGNGSQRLVVSIYNINEDEDITKYVCHISMRYYENGRYAKLVELVNIELIVDERRKTKRI